MDTIVSAPEFDALWGGTIRRVSLDLCAHTLSLEGEGLESGITRAFHIQALGITEFRFRDAISEPWDYAELTDVRVERRSGNLFAVFTLWSEASALEFKCSELLVNGKHWLAN